MGIEYSKELSFQSTTISGLIVLDLPVHGDARGWFKENFQRAKMTVAGGGELPDLRLPDLRIVQNNISFNANKGVTRGIHAEPWDKYVSVATGEVFGVWVDLREGSSTYGAVFTTKIDPSKAIFVPRGVGNAFQALEDNTAYTYLTNAHWSADAKSQYTFVNLADPVLGIAWPIPLKNAELSADDQAHPMLKDVKPMAPKKTLIIGANGQLGRAVRALLGISENFIYTDIVGENVTIFDASDASQYDKMNWQNIETIINCAAYTAVDQAETNLGRRDAWKVNAKTPGLLAKTASENDITLVHISTDYVFDGNLCNHPAGLPHVPQCEHRENGPLSPLGVYGQTKAAGDIAVMTAPKHYILRTAWVIGDGNNFVKTMKALSDKGISPEVVNDQLGRLTFTDTLAKGIAHLLASKAEYGVYNLTNSGRSASWQEIAAKVYELNGDDPQKVKGISTSDYNSKNVSDDQPIAPRPKNSVLHLSKIERHGFSPENWEEKLAEYIAKLKEVNG